MQIKQHMVSPPYKLAVMASLAMAAFSAHAFQIETPNPDLNIHWDNTVSYTAGMRVQGQNPAILNNPSFSESDNKFSSGQLFENRADIVSEFDVIFKDTYGFRISGEGWYDQAYHDTSTGLAPGPTSAGFNSAYTNGQYSSYIKKYYRGPGGQLLDAFVFGTFSAGAVPISVKLGQTSVYWGEALFNTANSVAYAQGPIDYNKATTSPGAKVSQLFLPVSQLTATAQVTPQLSVAGQYFLDWMPNRFPEGGTYFGTAGFLFNGPNQAYLAPGFALQNHAPLKPGYAGNFGLSTRWSPDWLGDGTVGVYFRRLAETTPFQTPEFNMAAGTYRLVYNDNVKLYGVSLSKAIGGVSMGAELNYRVHTALVNTGIDTATNQGPTGNTINALLNGTYILPRSPLWSTGTLAAELAYTHLQRVTSHEDLYQGVGYAPCNGLGSSDGCATRDALGLTLNFAPQYLQILPGVDLTIPITITTGLFGNGATSGTSSAHSWTWQIGASASIYAKYTVGLYYGGFYSHYKQKTAVNYPIAETTGNGPYMYNDRGYVMLTLQAAF